MMADEDPTPEQLESEFTGWRIWQGVNELYYARIKNCSLVLLREENTQALREEIRAEIRRRQDHAYRAP